MADQPNDEQSQSNSRSNFEPLPIEARRQLWEQIWNRLLAPPVEPEDLSQSEDHASDVTGEAAPDVAA